ncbi:MAG: hypothetical protein ACI3ZQ_09130 [Candidatus Cryptobacteroides sp.]
MKQLFIKTILCSLALLCVSCFKETDLGFPKTVTFSNEGGVQYVEGNRHFAYATVQNYKTGDQGSVSKNEEDLFYNELDWLRVEYHEINNETLMIYAEPNKSGKSRKLYIELYSGPDYQVIEVIQSR